MGHWHVARTHCFIRIRLQIHFYLRMQFEDLLERLHCHGVGVHDSTEEVFADTVVHGTAHLVVFILHESIIALSVPSSGLYFPDPSPVCHVRNHARVHHIHQILRVAHSVPVEGSSFLFVGGEHRYFQFRVQQQLQHVVVVPRNDVVHGGQFHLRAPVSRQTGDIVLVTDALLQQHCVPGHCCSDYVLVVATDATVKEHLVIPSFPILIRVDQGDVRVPFAFLELCRHLLRFLRLLRLFLLVRAYLPLLHRLLIFLFLVL